jgi:Ser/Thr protein kinase RdoA (MazF antagonist)
MTLPSPPADSTPTRDPRDIERALAAFGLTLESPPQPISESVLNENYHVETNAGPRFLRFVREDRTAERLLLEEKLIEHVMRGGVPVLGPVAVDGAPFVRLGPQFVQLFPWLDGRHGGPTEADAHAMGAMHARLHAALASFHHPDLRRRTAGVNWDTERSIQALSRIDDLIRYYPAPAPEALHIQDRLRFQLALLESPEARPATDFAAMETQACHGDYHNRNLLFGDGGDVVAVVDWEVANVLPPVYEIIRAVCFSGYLDPPLLGDYLDGYALNRRLTAADCRQGVEMWWQTRIHSFWALERRFIHGDRRVDRFFDEEADLLRRFADPAYREWLAAELSRPAS